MAGTTTATPEYFWRLLYAEDEHNFFKSHTFDPFNGHATFLDFCYTCSTHW